MENILKVIWRSIVPTFIATAIGVSIFDPTMYEGDYFITVLLGVNLFLLLYNVEKFRDK